jgi:hypothetical protein
LHKLGQINFRIGIQRKGKDLLNPLLCQLPRHLNPVGGQVRAVCYRQYRNSNAADALNRLLDEALTYDGPERQRVQEAAACLAANSARLNRCIFWDKYKSSELHSFSSAGCKFGLHDGHLTPIEMSAAAMAQVRWITEADLFLPAWLLQTYREIQRYPWGFTGSTG